MEKPVPGTVLLVYQKHKSILNSLAWSPDGKRIVSGDWSGGVQVWDTSNGGHVYTYRGHSGHVGSVAWSPDGKHIASGGADQTVQVWDASNGSHVYTYRGHSGSVYTVAWSPDGKHIASGGGYRDETVHVWQSLPIETKAPPLPEKKPRSTSTIDWLSLVETIGTDFFVTVATLASIIGGLDVIERRWREHEEKRQQQGTQTTSPSSSKAPVSDSEIVEILLVMDDGSHHSFERWVSNTDDLKAYIDAFSDPTSKVKPLQVIFRKHKGRSLRVDVTEGGKDNRQLNVILSYLEADPQ